MSIAPRPPENVKDLGPRAIIEAMSKELVEVRVHGVAVDGGDGMPVVLLLDPSACSGLPLQVGPFEASAIIIELEGIAPPRPLTHDLLAAVFQEGGLRLERAELFGNPETGPRARLVYRRGLARRSREVRPSDAIALALRLKAPICAEACLLDSREEAEEAFSAMVPEPNAFYVHPTGRAG